MLPFVATFVGIVAGKFGFGGMLVGLRDWNVWCGKFHVFVFLLFFFSLIIGTKQSVILYFVQENTWFFSKKCVDFFFGVPAKYQSVAVAVSRLLHFFFSFFS